MAQPPSPPAAAVVPPLPLHGSNGPFMLSPQMHALSPPQAATSPSRPPQSRITWAARRIIVLSVVISFIFSRHTLANGFISTLDMLLSADSGGGEGPIGCGNTVLDQIVLVVILLHHEIKLVAALFIGITADLIVSLFFRRFTASNAPIVVPVSPASPLAASPSSQLPPLTLPSPSHFYQQSSKGDPDDDENLLPGVITPRTVTRSAARWVPEAAQTRLIVGVVLLLLLGVDLGDASIRYMSLQVSLPLRVSKGSSSFPENHKVATNRHLECELKHAIAVPGLTIVSGIRQVGKSYTTKHVTANRSGFYCDVHSASSSSALEASLIKCVEEYSFFSSRIIPSAWKSLSLALRHLLDTYLWKIDHFGSIVAALDVAHRAATGGRAFTISDPEFLARRCSVRGGGGLPSGRQEQLKRGPHPPHPLVFVLDGIRDARDGPLGVMDNAPSLLASVQKMHTTTAVVVVAAADETVASVHDLPQFTSAISSRVAFVTAAPAELGEVGSVYDALLESLHAGTDLGVGTTGGCETDVLCAKQLFGGAFEFSREWINLMMPVPDSKEMALHSFCNAALRNVVFTAFARADAASGWQMLAPNIDAILSSSSRSKPSSSSSSSRSARGGHSSLYSSSSAQSSSVSFRLRSLFFMLQLSAHPLPITSIDPDVLESFLKAQLVFEDSLQSPACLFNDDQQHDAMGGGPMMLRAVAPRLFNVSLLHIITEKAQRIEESIQLLLEECDLRRKRLSSSQKQQHRPKQQQQQQQSMFGGLFGQPSSTPENVGGGEEEHGTNENCASDAGAGCHRWVGEFVAQLRKGIADHQQFYATNPGMQELSKNCGRALLLES